MRAPPPKTVKVKEPSIINGDDVSEHGDHGGGEVARTDAATMAVPPSDPRTARISTPRMRTAPSVRDGDDAWFESVRGSTAPRSPSRVSISASSLSAVAHSADLAEAMHPAALDEEDEDFLSFDEFCTYMSDRAEGVFTLEELAKRFEKLDVDGNGTVDRHEFIRFSLFEALAGSRNRVVDMLTEWDTDGDKLVSKREFRRAVLQLGFTFCSVEDIDTVFDAIDEDRSGAVDFRELNSQLRPSTVARNKFDLRRNAGGRRGGRMGSTMLSTAGSENVQTQLRSILVANRARVIDLFREWDADGDGLVDQVEFRDSVRALGYDAPRADVDALFASFDVDGSGSLEFSEINKLLRQTMKSSRRASSRHDSQQSSSLEQTAMLTLPRERGLPPRPPRVTHMVDGPHNASLAPQSPRADFAASATSTDMMRGMTQSSRSSSRGAKIRPGAPAFDNVPTAPSGLPLSYAIATHRPSMVPRDFRPGLGARVAVARAAAAAHDAEVVASTAANVALNDDILRFEGRLPGHLGVHLKQHRRQPSAVRVASSPLPSPCDSSMSPRYQGASPGRRSSESMDTHRPDEGSNAAVSFETHFGPGSEWYLRGGDNYSHDDAERLSAKHRLTPQAPLDMISPTHPGVHETLEILRGGAERRRHEQHALNHRISVLQKAAQRRRDAASEETGLSLRRSVIDSMRAPAVFSLAAPKSARGTPSAFALAATLQGRDRRILTARGPPPPARLLTPLSARAATR